MTHSNLPTLPSETFSDLLEKFISGSNLYNTSRTHPRYEYRETQDGVTFQLALAGYSKDLLEVEAGNERLVIKSSKKESEDSFFASRAFKKEFILPPRYNLSKIDCSFKNGLLTIFVPIKEDSKMRSIKIK